MEHASTLSDAIERLSLHDNLSQSETIEGLLLQKHITSLRDMVEKRPKGILVLGSYQARNYLVESVLPNTQTLSCSHYAIGLGPKISPQKEPICLDDVDIPCDLSQVELFLKSLFLRAHESIIIGLADSVENVPKSLIRAGRFEFVLSITSAPSSVRRLAWENWLQSLLSDDPRFQFPSDSGAQLAAKSPGFDVSDFLKVINTFYATSAAQTGRSKTCSYSFDMICEMVACHSPMQATADLSFISSNLSSKEQFVTDWGSHAGYDEVKSKLLRLCEWPMKHAETFARLGVRPPRGVLLHGPHGVGKTMLAEALLQRLVNANSVRINASELFCKYLGESEARVRRLFARARMLNPCIIFIDDIDAAGERGIEDSSGVEGRVVAALLTELDGVQGDEVFVVACAADITTLDPAMIRPGRLDNMIEIGIPQQEDRREILEAVLKVIPIGGGLRRETLIDWLVTATMGMTGAELTAICDEAGMLAIEAKGNDAKTVDEVHFHRALANYDV